MKKKFTRWLMTALMGVLIISASCGLDAKAIEKKKTIESKLNYLYIDEAQQDKGTEQSIVLSWGEDISDAENISLVIEDETKRQFVLNSEKREGELFLYQNSFSEGIYHLEKAIVKTDSGQTEFTADDLGIEAYFGVGKTVSESKKSDYIEMDSVDYSADEASVTEASVVSIEENGEVSSENNIAEALDSQEKTKTGRALTSKTSDIVVVLDPGHDSKHAGSRGNGVKEEVVTLKIAKYCKEELDQYKGIKVYLTRNDEDCPFPKSKDNVDDIVKRVEWAKTKGADVFVSIHLNSSTASGAKGAEVYYPNSGKYSSTGKELAQKIQDELVDLGLKDRGVKGNETYAVVNSSNKNGFPGLIVEHAFLSNSSDVKNYLTSESSIKKLGIADAKGIAEYFGLKKGEWEKQPNGTWKWKDADGVYSKNTWEYISGKWYYFGSDGIMLTDWQEIGGKYYYLSKPNGDMKTGWLKLDKKWYYLSSSGARVSNSWKWIGGKCYYFDKNGVMASNEWIGDDYVDENGAWNPDIVKAHWIKSGSRWWYRHSDGSYTKSNWEKIDGKWYYFDKAGWMQTGWEKVKGKWYYLNGSGAMQTGWQKVSGKWYYMNSSGVMQTGWKKLDGKWYYLDSNGVMVTGWKWVAKKCYYFDKNGVMVSDTWIGDDYVDSDGVWDPDEKKPSNVPPSNEQITKYYSISGTNSVTVSQMVKYFNKKAIYPSEDLKKGGASTIEEFCQIYYEECEAEGIKVEVAFIQAMHETGNLKFGGDVKIEQFNFAGLGATGNENPGNSFKDVREGVRAQVQHLKCYANKEPLKNDCVDPRWEEWLRGKAPYVEWLSKDNNPNGIGWATDPKYAEKLLAGISELKKM